MSAGWKAGEQLAESLIERTAPGLRADARVLERRFLTLRFAVNRITQPHQERIGYVSYRVVDDGRVATATTSDLSPAGLDAVVRTAVALAREAPKVKGFPDFPRGGGDRSTPIPDSSGTRDADPAKLAPRVDAMIERAVGAVPSARVSGAVHSGGERLAVANSSGLVRSSSRSSAQASILIERLDRDPPVSGWADSAHYDIRRLDLDALADESVRTVPPGPLGSIEPGAYPVVLAGAAAAEWFTFLSYLGFGAVGEIEGWGCLRGRWGKRIFSPELTVRDEPRSAESLPRGLDGEGLTTRPMTFIDRGRPTRSATDLERGRKLHRPSSAHAPFPESPGGPDGPRPLNLVVAPGTLSESELLEAVGTGILVTRLHYVRIVDPGEAVLTGMTRDGTYRIVHGERGEAVRNLRFTESIVGSLGRLKGVGRSTDCHGSEHGEFATTTPALAVGSFRFTSATVF